MVMKSKAGVATRVDVNTHTQMYAPKMDGAMAKKNKLEDQRSCSAHLRHLLSKPFAGSIFNFSEKKVIQRLSFWPYGSREEHS